MNNRLSYICKPRTTPYVYQTVIDAIREHEQQTPEKEICIEHSVEGKRRVLTYRKLVIDAQNVAQYLLYKGIRKGDHVGLFGLNSLELITADVGVAMAGAVCVNFLLTPSEPASKFNNVAKQAECKALFLEPGLNSECSYLVSKMI